MLNWLKSLFQTQARPQKTMEMQARLAATNGQPLHGEAEFEVYENGGWELEAEVDFRDGHPAEPLIVYMADKAIMNLHPQHDESEGKLSSRRGDILSVIPQDGMSVEVRRGSETVLSGQFEVHPRFR